MSQPLLPPGWAEKEPADTRRCFRVDEASLPDKRSRGGRRGTAARFGLRSLPPIDEDNPEDFGV